MHDGGAELKVAAELAVDAQFGDALDLAQAFGHFVAALLLHAPRKRGDDVLARQTVAVRALDGEDEGKAEFGVVVGVEALQRGEFLGAAQVQAGFGLFVARFRGQFAGDRRLAGQLGVGADQAELFVDGGGVDVRLQRLFQRGGAGEGPRRPGAFGYPGRGS